MIKVLITDDSRTIQMVLKAMLDQDPEMKVVGIASNGKEAVEMSRELQPDIITMDVRMPVMNGLEATEEIMSTDPRPILVVSASVNDDELKIAFNAIEAGALAVIEKPPGLESDDYDRIQTSLINHLKVLSKVKVKKKLQCIKSSIESRVASRDPFIPADYAKNDLVALGASVGGPLVLEQILSNLPRDFPLPIVIVQHMSSGFIDGLVSWLDSSSPLTVKVVDDGELLKPGFVYVGARDQHFTVEREQKQLVVKLSDYPKNSTFCPSVDELFFSVAKVSPGHAIAGLLTGMGSDGAEGLLSLHKSQCYTFIQSEETCIVFGMPGVAKKMGAHDDEVPQDQIANCILSHINFVKDARKGKNK